MRRLFESPAFISLFCGLIVAYSNLATVVSQEPDKPSQPGGESAVDPSLLPSGEVIRPAGETISYYGRPIDIASFPAKSLLFVKDRSSLLVIDAVKFEIRQSIELKGGASINGITVLKDGTVLVSNAQNQLQSFQANSDGLYELKRKVEFASSSYPCGVCVNRAETRAFVALSKRNSVAVVDLATFALVREIEVGVAPFDVALSGDETKLIVSNIGGRRPDEGEATAPSAGTEVVVDARGIAATGSVSVIDVQENKLFYNVR